MVEPGTQSDPLMRSTPPLPVPERRIPPFQVMRAVSENNRMMHLSLRELKTQRRWVFLAMAVACLISSLVYWVNPPLYGSTVSFYVLAPPVSDKDKPIYLSLYTDAITLRHIATSTAMFDHLIETYGLQDHYGLPNGTPDERSILHQILQSRISVDLRESEIVAVRVRDSDRKMAALLANGLYMACDSMLRAEQQAQLVGQVRMYDQVMDSTEMRAKSGYAQLMRAVAALKDLRSGPPDELRNERAEAIEHALMDAADDIASTNRELVVQRRNHANLLAMARDPMAGPVRLKSKATADLGPTPLWRSIQWILTITIAAGVVSAAILLLIIETWMSPQPEPVPAVRR
jgi:capsular polysaccharide biosynthesis protein